MQVKTSYFFSLLVVMAILADHSRAFGQQLVDAPSPKLISRVVDGTEPKLPPALPTATAPLLVHSQPPAPVHEFFDRQNMIMLSAAFAMRSADAGYTCATGVGTTEHNANGTITVHREDYLPVNSCHGVALMNTAFTGMGLAGGYLLHRMHRHRLERVPNWIVASVPVFGIAYTATHQHENAPANSK
jgi:hypothetical protein